MIYHVGPTVTLKTKADAGRLRFDEGAISLDGSHPIDLPLKNIKSVEWVTMPGTGHMVKVNSDPDTVYISVVRLNIRGYFVIVNLRKLVSCSNSCKAETRYLRDRLLLQD